MSTEQTYRAAVVERFGPPDGIRVRELSSRPLRAGEVRVAVRTGGLNPVDARIRRGSFGGTPPMPLGTEFAGVVVEIGGGVNGFTPGDAVIGFGAQGADADLVITDPSRLAHKPEELDWSLAGGISGVGQSALTALSTLDLAPESVVLVHGASGGVGTMLVQLAIADGHRVIGTGGPSSQDYLRDLGATPVLYGDGLAGRVKEASPTGVDAAVDLAGTHQAGEISRAIADGGGKAITLVPETMSSHRLPLVRVQHSHDQLERLITEAIAGRLTLPVEVIPFTDIAEAHRRLDAKHARGKIVLDLSDNPHLTPFADVAGLTAGA
jgi:enoyl reductase